MNKLVNLLFRSVFLLAALIAAENSAFAFLPGGESLIKFMIEKKGVYYNYMKVPYGEQLYTDDEKSVAMDMNLYYSSSGVFKADIFFNGHKKIYMESLTKSVNVQDGLLLSENHIGYFMFKDILWMNDPELLKTLLEKRGCRIDHVRFDRSDDMVFFVVGEISDSENRSCELWIDKENFLPYKYMTSESGERFTFIFSNWFKSGGLKYPGMIEIFLGENKIRVVKAKRADLDFNPDAGFFNIDEFISSFKEDGENGDKDKNYPMNTMDKIFQ